MLVDKRILSHPPLQRMPALGPQGTGLPDFSLAGGFLMTRPAIILAILFLLLAFWQSGKAEAHPTAMRDVVDASRYYGVPLEMSLAVWGYECGRQEECKRGRSGEWGPFQIMRIAARHVKCRGEWRWGRGNAFCGVKVLAWAWKRCKWDRLGAFSSYNRPAERCRSTRYARNVFKRMRIHQQFAWLNWRNWMAWEIPSNRRAG